MKRNLLSGILGIFILVVFLAACSGPEFGSLKGALINQANGEPLVVELTLFQCDPTSAEGECDWSLTSNQLRGSSDASGLFQLDEIPPGRYAVGLGSTTLGQLNFVDPSHWFVTIEAGEVVDWGGVLIQTQ